MTLGIIFSGLKIYSLKSPCPSKNQECHSSCHSCTSNHNELLVGLDIKSRTSLDENKSHVSFSRGEYIYKEGVFPAGLFCLRKGKVMITKSDNAGNTIVINLHKEVTFLGIADYVANKSYQTSCVALDDIQVCFHKRDVIQSFITENRLFLERMMKDVADQYHQANKRLLSNTKKYMNARLAGALVELYDVYGLTKDGYLDVYLKRAELASLSNMSVANTIRHLSDFQKMGLVSLDGKQIKIASLDPLLIESQVS